MQLSQSLLAIVRQRVNRIQLVRFLISLVLATLLWGWVTQVQDPMQDREFVSVPITVSGLSDSLILVTSLPSADIVLSGPRSEIQRVRLADLALTLDLSGFDQPGTDRVSLDVSKPSGVDVDSVSPREIQVQVEELTSQNFPLEYEKNLSDDDPREIGTVTPSVTEVTVSGPSTAMSRVAKVVLPITVNQQTSTFTASFTPRAVDAQGQTISEVTILPQSIPTTVEVKTRGKEISVIPIITGSPADGYSVQQKSVVPEVILVDGPEDILNSLLFVNTQPVDITGATTSISQRVAIADLPDDVTIITPSDGMVELRVAIEDTTNTSQVIPSIPIQVLGLQDGLTATVDPTAATITIDASQAVLQSLAVSDILVTVSADGLGPGTYQLDLSVSLPNGVSLVSTDRQNVRVIIADADATPDSTPDTPE